ncbi:MAG TPA: radical SAM protein [Synergistales bacterium]|nr:radical SAM protein [Synergistales bacterium]
MRRIPFFLPMKDCPNRCIYCDQRTITGHEHQPGPGEVRRALQEASEPVETCFFGGSFTCQPLDRQEEYLEAAAQAPACSRIRISTHPLCVDPGILDFLSRFPVRFLELGISSLEDKVLDLCNRGYTGSAAVERISLAAGSTWLVPGVQLMTGLPGQDLSSSLEDLRVLAEIKGDKAMQLRIYPCLVLRGTQLEELFLSGSYTPPGIDESARWAGRMIREALKSGFELLRVGLQETASLGEGVVAGPHHPALGELARSYALALSLVDLAGSGPWPVPFSSRSLLSGHGDWGFRELASLSGMAIDEVKHLVKWTR